MTPARNITDRAERYRDALLEAKEFHASVIRRLDGPPISRHSREAFRGLAAGLRWAIDLFEDCGLKPDK